VIVLSALEACFALVHSDSRRLNKSGTGKAGIVLGITAISLLSPLQLWLVVLCRHLFACHGDCQVRSPSILMSSIFVQSVPSGLIYRLVDSSVGVFLLGGSLDFDFWP
jgi:hypothetical protein